MEKFPILCTLSALIVFLGAAIGAAGVKTGVSNDLPFGFDSAKQIENRAGVVKTASVKRQDATAFIGMDLPKSVEQLRDAGGGLLERGGEPVEISGDLLVSF